MQSLKIFLNNLIIYKYIIDSKFYFCTHFLKQSTEGVGPGTDEVPPFKNSCEPDFFLPSSLSFVPITHPWWGASLLLCLFSWPPKSDQFSPIDSGLGHRPVGFCRTELNHYSSAPKSEHSKLGECRNPDEKRFGF